MSQEPPKECVINGQLECYEKRELTRRGVRFAHIKLRRTTGHSVKFTVPVEQATGVEIGGYYKIAILPDRAPDVPTPLQLNPGDHVLEWSKWAGLKVWRHAVLIGFTPGGRAIIRDWTRRAVERKVKVANLTLASDPFPALEDFTTILAGDAVLWRGKRAIVSEFVSSDQAVVTYPIFEAGWTSAFEYQSKLVPLSQLIPLGPQEDESSAPFPQNG